MTTPFHDYLRQHCDRGFATEDALASFLPLTRQVVATHEAGLCAPLVGLSALKVDGVQIWFEEAARQKPQTNLGRVQKMLAPESKAVHVLSETSVVRDVDTGEEGVDDSGSEDRADRPSWHTGYVCWEHEVGHHDPLTDTFSLGLILASLACSIDLTERADLDRFIENRGNLFAITPGLHPVLAKAIRAMTELDRHKRPQDLPSLVRALENYRDQDVDFDTDLARHNEFEGADRPGKRQIILNTLKKRLFEISRRNRLLQFKPTMQTVNLTEASIPLMFDYRSLREDQVLTWNHQFRREVLSGKAVSLNKYLNFREAVYLPGTLDRIRTEGVRDEKEFGFGQLRLVVCFLRWANLKEDPVERFESPLLLLPVKLTVKKGIRDRHAITVLESDAEVNPVVRHCFKQLYDIDLPNSVNPTAEGIEAFHTQLSAQIQASDASVTLKKIDKPRIDLIHEKARRRLDQFRRRVRLSGRGIRKFRDLDYSYDPTNYHPLGIRIFDEIVRPPKTQLERIVSTGPPPPHYMTAPSDPPVAEAEQNFFSVRNEEDDNPFNWEFDLCSVTLSNLKYRRMSLVRDYDELAGESTENAAFDATFSLDPREVESDFDSPAVESKNDGAPGDRDPISLADRFHVVPCDPTQTSAIALARTGTSYIIQGPPGTGKSQTITNLIADFVARGQRVLFVCEKRAAIDVVYHRLKQCGLHELCCLIHDSQADKKEFVMDLKSTYEAFLDGAKKRRNHQAKRRSQLIAQIEEELEPLARFDAAMRSVPEICGVPLRSVLNRRLALDEQMPDLSPVQWEHIPPHRDWADNLDPIEALTETIPDIQSDGILAHHPLRMISPRVSTFEHPHEQISNSLQRGLDQIDRLLAQIDAANVASEVGATFDELTQVVDYATQAAFLAKARLLSVLNASSDAARQLDRGLAKLNRQDKEIAKRRESTAAWREKLSPADTETALDQARSLHGSLLRFLSPNWWRLRGILNRAYDFAQHQVRPSWVRILEQLRDEYAAVAAREELADDVRNSLGIEDNFAEFSTKLAALREAVRHLPEPAQRVHEGLVNRPEGNDRVLRLAALKPDIARLGETLESFLDGYRNHPIRELTKQLQMIATSLDQLPGYLHCLSLLTKVSDDLATAIRTIPIAIPALESATLQRSLDSVWRENPIVARFDGTSRRRHVSRLHEMTEAWQSRNATLVHELVRQSFIENVNISKKPAAQLTPEQKDFKKVYNRGRRGLEHEFGKSMRYKSIRDLVSGDSGVVVRDLKPVWLMSPLSVSDTLPLDPQQFDVVIFDEASQITLEEAVPSIFRAQQTIVVGDEMQLPPTAFFLSRRQEEDEELVFEEDGELVEYDLNSSSLLNHAARNLKSRMLGWHYRSRSESLISFSNHAFYEGRLLTVPDERIPRQQELPHIDETSFAEGETPAEPPSRDHAQAVPSVRQETELNVETLENANAYADELLDRPVSFHFVNDGVYEKRRNTAEAEYITRLVRRILEREEGHSVGIVAFSEAQQMEIERALQSLAEDDEEFAHRLEVEREREEDDQFVGLLVKNLENIQGDERDVIIMSVCYGPAADGKVRMNFGPINVSGGEKRLNVAFSRARCHMALVSSMRSAAITNDYNDGANCLKNYLRYAEAASKGDTDTMSLVLHGLSAETESESASADDAVVQQLASELVARGFKVTIGVGQSKFRCDLAVSRPADRIYKLGILVDTAEWYEQRDLLERELMKPTLLRAFGWNICVVLARDWFDDREGTLHRIEQMLARQDEANSEPTTSPPDDEKDHP